MTIPTWPPQRTAATFYSSSTDARGFVLADGFSATLPVLANRTPTDSGPVKQRRVSTARPELLSLRYLMTSLDRDWLIAFYKGDAAGGGVWFNWTDPTTNTVRLARFQAEQPPKIEAYAPDWLVTVQLEVRDA